MTYTCQQCGKLFEAPPSAQRITCSIRCKALRHGVWLAGTVPDAAVAARAAHARRRHRAQIALEFGDLSVRELAIIRRVYWAAYNRGYSRALHRVPRKQTA